MLTDIKIKTGLKDAFILQGILARNTLIESPSTMEDDFDYGNDEIIISVNTKQSERISELKVFNILTTDKHSKDPYKILDILQRNGYICFISYDKIFNLKGQPVANIEFMEKR